MAKRPRAQARTQTKRASARNSARQSPAAEKARGSVRKSIRKTTRKSIGEPARTAAAGDEPAKPLPAEDSPAPKVRTARATAAHRHTYTPELLEEMRRRYEETPESLASIGAEGRIDPTTVSRIARRKKWVRYVAPPRDLSPAAKLAAKARALASGSGGEAAAQQESGEGAATSAANLPPPAETVAQLHADVLKEIAAVEAMRRRLDATPQRPIDAERTARTLASLFATLRQIVPLSPVPAQVNEHDNNDDFPTDIDELRNELARRITAFVESGPSDGPAPESAGNGAAET